MIAVLLVALCGNCSTAQKEIEETPFTHTPAFIGMVDGYVEVCSAGNPAATKPMRERFIRSYYCDEPADKVLSMYEATRNSSDPAVRAIYKDYFQQTKQGYYENRSVREQKGACEAMFQGPSCEETAPQREPLSREPTR